MHRVVAASALLFVASSATLPAEGGSVLTRDCTTTFVAKWLVDREAALGNPPKRPCWMHASTGLYVCSREGCVRPHVYFNNR
jgi:hypothetical protein